MPATDSTSDNRRYLALWLFICAALIFAMVVLGGITRLTGSGLSMVEWDPVFGIVPPLTESDWQGVFEKYQQSPEYQKINFSMGLAGFKAIFLVEYAHRVLGRTIGLVFLLPMLFFYATRRIPPGMTLKFITMFVLGGLQGLLGWYMVKSGLVDNPHVSQYRLTAHFMLAVLIYGYIVWVALGLLEREKSRVTSGFRGLSLLVLALVVLTMTTGGFVAGLKAGLAYNTFPLMDGKVVPEGLMAMQPWYLNLFENIATVQFDHRVLAISTFILICVLWVAGRRQTLEGDARYMLNGVLILGIVQVSLGIATLLMQVPVPFASAHQAGALLVFTLALALLQKES